MGGSSQVRCASCPHEFNDVSASDYLCSTFGTSDIRITDDVRRPSGDLRSTCGTNDIRSTCGTCGTDDLRITNDLCSPSNDIRCASCSSHICCASCPNDLNSISEHASADDVCHASISKHASADDVRHASHYLR